MTPTLLQMSVRWSALAAQTRVDNIIMVVGQLHIHIHISHAGTTSHYIANLSVPQVLPLGMLCSYVTMVKQNKTRRLRCDRKSGLEFEKR